MIATATNRARVLAACLLAALGSSALPALAQAPRTEYEGSAALGLALRRLGTTKRVLMIGAHPDDESTQILSTLALGQGADVAYLSLTRGEGGQNGIGPELQEGLGLLRTEELLAARRLDGARQYFTRAYDYGYSKDADEAFRHWPRDSVLADVVAAVRDFRPDLVLAVFSGTPRDGHGQHQASGILAREAFLAAADPARFPEQIRRGLRPHAAAKLYQSLWRRDEGAAERLSTGEMDPLLGRSFYQIAMASRSRHRSQDMGRPLVPGPQSSALRLVETRVAAADGAGPFAGVDTTLAQRLATRQGANGGNHGADRIGALLAGYQAATARAAEEFNPLHPERSVAPLAEAVARLGEAEALADAAGAAQLAWHARVERQQAEAALRQAAGLVLDVVAADEAVVPGQAFELELSLWNGGRREVRVEELAPVLPTGWSAEPLDAAPAELGPGQLASRRFRVVVPAGAEPVRPYFLRRPRQGDLYAWPADHVVGVPFEAPPVRAAARVRVAGAVVGAEGSAAYRGVDKMVGEFRRPVRVVPAVSVVLDPGLAILPLGAGGREPLRFSVRLRAERPGGIAGTVRPEVPAGWSVEPAAVPVRFAGEGEERVVEFRVSPPDRPAPGAFPVSVEFRAESGERFREGFSLVDYPHTQPRPLYRPAESTVRALEVSLPADLRVGYVAGPGDEVPAALAQLGVRVEPLGPEQLAAADLSVYDVVVTGIRAYEVRPDLVAHNQRLLDYARGGGTVIVQYNKYEYEEPGIAPYPVSMARPHDRVTDEEAPVRVLDPDHPALSRPNRITSADFEGWVQERGLYFLNRWDQRYTPLLEMADAGEPPLRGALLVAPYGKGTYVYTGLALFRQLPAGVPGAYRLFANLLALGAKD